jgi:hypothetical protein
VGKAAVVVALWVPGKFRLTNRMLSDLRAAGVYEGRSRGRARAGGAHDLFTAETAAIRAAVCLAARGAKCRPVPTGERVNVASLVFGHRRFDPDAFSLVSKPAIDGLVDAGVIAKDRHDVGLVLGHVFTSAADEEWGRRHLWVMDAAPPGVAGLLVAYGVVRGGVL